MIKIATNQTFWFKRADFHNAKPFQIIAQINKRTIAQMGSPSVTDKSASAIKYIVNAGL